ncbi:lysozyme-like protein [Anaeramoeba flamelloides]|uniref:Lysozyme-like protein n=1 Tax=Anaeramoeba flamelloides TaxID=1746091 RepID=A0AAV8AE72_9EUKA|nr:lysozyme-like protein [Anaeramoeba flamelloides]
MKLAVLVLLFSIFAYINAGYCDTCGSSSYVDISSWCSKYSGWSQECCKCIAEHESSGNIHACNKNTDASIDVGLWQINSRNWDACNGGKAPCTASENLACAKDVFGWGSHTWKYWSTCSTCGCCHKA